MAKKMKNLKDMESEVESMAQEVKEAPAEMKAAVQQPLVEFDAWFASRKSKIDGHHYKEIIMADMKARGVAMLNTMKAFDEALAKYGIKLK